MLSRSSRAIRQPLLLLLAASLAGACQRRVTSVKTPDPGGSYQIEWISVESPSILNAGEETSIPVTFRNTGGAPIPEPLLAISYHWMDASDPQRVIVWDGLRTAVGRTVRSNETHAAQVRLRAPDRPGQYILNVDLVREGIAWFSAKGAPFSSHPVTVK